VIQLFDSWRFGTRRAWLLGRHSCALLGNLLA
jgi:hypothetical protein